MRWPCIRIWRFLSLENDAFFVGWIYWCGYENVHGWKGRGSSNHGPYCPHILTKIFYFLFTVWVWPKSKHDLKSIIRLHNLNWIFIEVYNASKNHLKIFVSYYYLLLANIIVHNLRNSLLFIMSTKSDFGVNNSLFWQK